MISIKRQNGARCSEKKKLLVCFYPDCLAQHFHLWKPSGSVAEWSKALVLGTSPKGRGFESLSCQNDNFASIKKSGFAPGEARTHNPSMSQVLSISTVR